MTPTEEAEHLAEQQELTRLQQLAAKQGHELRQVNSGYVVLHANGSIHHSSDLTGIAKALTRLAAQPISRCA